MRSAKEEDYWKAISKRKYKYGIQKINLHGLIGIDEIIFNDGIIAICGLNGAGKSTIISAIKDLIGIKKSKVDDIKINSNKITGTFKNKNAFIDCENQEKCRVIDKGIDQDIFNYIDYEKITKTQLFLTEQTNLDELIEQNEELILEKKEIEEICYIVGKRYDACSIREIEDVEGLGTIPFFSVRIGDTEYDSTKMGVGEHFLFYLFWLLLKIEKDALLIIEEPESFISIASQVNIINYIASVIDKKGISIIVTTHSPYILGRIKNENIRIMSKVGNNSTVFTPTKELSVEGLLGIKKYECGTFFVEDRVAKEFLIALLEDKAPYILKNYNIEVADGGETAISDRLSFKYSDKMQYLFVGIYDGDMKSRLDSKKLNWPFCFLPMDESTEYILMKYLYSNIRIFSNSINKDEKLLMTILAKIEGIDPHDWFIGLFKELALDPQYVVKQLYLLWENEAANQIEKFIIDLEKCLNFKGKRK